MDVIKKLQIKFIITVVLILTFVFTLIVVGINTFNRQKTEGMYEYFSSKR